MCMSLLAYSLAAAAVAISFCALPLVKPCHCLKPSSQATAQRCDAQKLYDAVISGLMSAVLLHEAVDESEDQMNAITYVVVMTDGEDNCSDSDLAEVQARFTAAFDRGHAAWHGR